MKKMQSVVVKTKMLIHLQLGYKRIMLPELACLFS